MQGMGPCVLGIVDLVASNFPRVTYVEIGVYDGITLSEISHRLDINLDVDSWRSIGIDLPDCRHETTRRNSTDKGLQFELVRPPLRKSPKWDCVTFVLKDSHSFLGEYAPSIGDVHLALIDGCHGKNCVATDFLLLEPLIVPGGYVMFHDFGADQIDQPQAPPDHCEFVGVHHACEDLGLLNNSRSGWMFVQTIIGEKHNGSADMGVFQKL